MRYFFILAGLTSLCLTGCGNGNDNNVVIQQANPVNGTVLPGPSPLDVGVQINPSTAVSISTTVFNTAFTQGGVAQLANTTLFSLLDTRHPNALSEDLLASIGQIVAGGSGTFTGTGGGQAVVTVNNTTGVNLVFNGFSTANGTLTGSVLYQGSVSTAGFASNATFNALQVRPVNAPAYRLDGPAGYNVTRTSATSAITVYNANQLVTDTTSTGTARFVNYLTVTNVSFNGTNPANVTITQRPNGRIVFSNFQNLTGFIDIANQVPNVATGRTAVAGQGTLTGIGATRLTVVGPDQVEIAYSNAGQNLFTPVSIVSALQILGF